MRPIHLLKKLLRLHTWEELQVEQNVVVSRAGEAQILTTMTHERCVGCGVHRQVDTNGAVYMAFMRAWCHGRLYGRQA